MTSENENEPLLALAGVRGCARKIKIQIDRTMAEYLNSNQNPEFSILVIGAKDRDDLEKNANHVIFSDTIGSIRLYLHNSYPFRNCDVKIEEIYVPSLRDNSGNSIFSTMEYMPTIIIFLNHGFAKPGYPSRIEDLDGSAHIHAKIAASEINSLQGFNLLNLLTVCKGATISKPFIESENIGAIYAPLDYDFSEGETLSEIIRIFNEEMRRDQLSAVLEYRRLYPMEAIL
ncbi:MAG: hypothetical protein CMA79_02535 [Euryarchaeota archaeon]|nr:hypothetical protein [Euryarchaeota archaeon]|tara:strand:- start:1908 stop:2597 length:690 start_codon:yes stop_codon:yes gene_type:complete